MSHHGCEHAAAAAHARYGVMLSEADFAAMVGDIVSSLVEQEQRALLLCRQESAREVWIAQVPNGPAVCVVYDPHIAMIVTVLPPRWRRR